MYSIITNAIKAIIIYGQKQHDIQLRRFVYLPFVYINYNLMNFPRFKFDINEKTFDLLSFITNNAPYLFVGGFYVKSLQKMSSNFYKQSYIVTLD